MLCKEGQSDVVELMVNDHLKTFSTNLNAQHVNGMTVQSRKLVKMHVRLLDTLEYVPIMKHQNSVSVDLMVNFLPYDLLCGNIIWECAIARQL